MSNSNPKTHSQGGFFYSRKEIQEIYEEFTISFPLPLQDDAQVIQQCEEISIMKVGLKDFYSQGGIWISHI